MSTPQVALPGLEIDPGNGPILGNFGQGAMEIAIREAIAEIEAEKATQELESPATGTLVEILAPEGSEVKVRTLIAWIETDA